MITVTNLNYSNIKKNYIIENQNIQFITQGINAIICYVRISREKGKKYCKIYEIRISEGNSCRKYFVIGSLLAIKFHAIHLNNEGHQLHVKKNKIHKNNKVRSKASFTMNIWHYINKFDGKPFKETNFKLLIIVHTLHVVAK